MTTKPISSVDEEESQDTAPSEKSAKQTPPVDGDMGAIMAGMTDYELVQVGLVALALLHQRADANLESEETE